MRRWFILGALAVASVLTGNALAAPAPTHTKRQAEINILRSPRIFWSWGLHGFIRSRTKTFRTNVVVICTGGHGPELRAHTFVCALHYRARTVNVRYTALGKYAFKLHAIPRA